MKTHFFSHRSSVLLCFCHPSAFICSGLCGVCGDILSNSAHGLDCRDIVLADGNSLCCPDPLCNVGCYYSITNILKIVNVLIHYRVLLARNKHDVSSSPSSRHCRTPTTPSPSTPSIPSTPSTLRHHHTPMEASCNHFQEGNSEFGQEAFERQSLISSASYELQRNYHSIQ